LRKEFGEICRFFVRDNGVKQIYVTNLRPHKRLFCEPHRARFGGSVSGAKPAAFRR
jgi:hypothetical protein